MAARRFLYLTALVGCGCFSLVYGAWLSRILLVMVLGVPWVSLLLSLPALLTFRVTPGGETPTAPGQEQSLFLLGSCPWPMPPFRGRLRLQRLFTGEVLRYHDHRGFRPEHCGGYLVTAEHVRVCDYLGLFSFPVRKKEKLTLLVRPKPLEVPAPEGLRRYIARSWRPKFGGGFAENHELRLYRPGDSLNQVHWKLTAKTGKLMLREPMEPQRGPVLLTVNLRGVPEELDRKLGRLLWLGNYILQQALTFEIRALTGKGTVSYAVSCEEDLQKALDKLLCQPLAQEGDLREQTFRAAWLYHVGGQADES